MAGQYCTSANLETALSPAGTLPGPGPFSQVVGSPLINVGAGVAGNNTITLPQGAFVSYTMPQIPALPVSFALGFGLSLATAPTALTSILAIATGTDTVSLSVDPTGVLTLNAGASFNVATAGGTYQFTGVRQYVEVYLSGIGAGVTGKVQYEGTTLVTGTGTTYSSGANFSNFVHGAAVNLTNPLIIDSVYMLDLTGSGRNFLLGKRVVTWQISASVGQFSQGTPNGAATDWQALAPIPPAGDAIYMYDDTPGDQTAVGVSSPFGLSSVDFVMQRASARQEVGSGGRTIALGVGDGSTIVYGATQNLPVGYTGLNQVWDEDPTTSSPWALGSLGSRQAAVKTVT